MLLSCQFRHRIKFEASGGGSEPETAGILSDGQPENGGVRGVLFGRFAHPRCCSRILAKEKRCQTWSCSNLVVVARELRGWKWPGEHFNRMFPFFCQAYLWQLFDKIDSVQGVPHRAVASVCGITGAIVLWGVKLGFVPSEPSRLQRIEI